jgi:hypothetical protein
MKANFSINRTSTINVGNFESIKPNINIELKNVSVNKIDDVYKELSSIIDELYQLEQANLYADIKSIRNTGIDKHIKSIIDQDFEKMSERININLSSLKGMEDE